MKMNSRLCSDLNVMFYTQINSSNIILKINQEIVKLNKRVNALNKT